MAQWCLKANGKIVPRRSVFPLTTAQLNSEVEIRKRQEFDQKIRARYGDSLKLPPVPLTDTDFVPYEDDENKPRVMPESEAVDAAGLPVLQQSPTDHFINNQVYLPQGESMQVGTVK